MRLFGPDAADGARLSHRRPGEHRRRRVVVVTDDTGGWLRRAAALVTGLLLVSRPASAGASTAAQGGASPYGDLWQQHERRPYLAGPPPGPATAAPLPTPPGAAAERFDALAFGYVLARDMLPLGEAIGALGKELRRLGRTLAGQPERVGPASLTHLRASLQHTFRILEYSRHAARAPFFGAPLEVQPRCTTLAAGQAALEAGEIAAWVLRLADDFARLRDLVAGLSGRRVGELQPSDARALGRQVAAAIDEVCALEAGLPLSFAASPPSWLGGSADVLCFAGWGGASLFFITATLRRLSRLWAAWARRRRQKSARAAAAAREMPRRRRGESPAAAGAPEQQCPPSAPRRAPPMPPPSPRPSLPPPSAPPPPSARPPPVPALQPGALGAGDLEDWLHSLCGLHGKAALATVDGRDPPEVASARDLTARLTAPAARPLVQTAIARLDGVDIVRLRGGLRLLDQRAKRRTGGRLKRLFAGGEIGHMALEWATQVADQRPG